MLTTFKKDGTPVGVPVWAAPDGDRIVVWTNRESWKVKRVRRNPEVTLQACDARGRKTTGAVVTGVAVLQDGVGTEATRAAIGKKYGIIGVVGVRASRLLRGKDATIGLSIAEKV